MNNSMAARLSVLLGLLASTLPVRAQLYSEQYIGDLGGGETQTSAINGYGKVTGRSSLPGDRIFHAILWNGTTMRDLGTLGGTQSYGAAINAAGQVTGFSDTASDAAQHAFLWNGTAMEDLGTLGGSNSEGTGINASGEVTGWSQTPGNAAEHAFLWNGTTMKDLGTLGGTNSSGVAINDSGQVAGSSDVIGNAHSHAFLWKGASMKDLGTVGGAPTVEPFAMNNAGQVVGAARNDSYSVETGFLWDGSKLVDLNALTGATRSYASALNAKGEVTGWAVLSTDKKIHSYLWKGTEAFRLDVNTASDREFNFCDTGTGISSSTGLIVGETCEEAGLNYPFFWNGFAMVDLANLVAPADFNLDLGASPLINNQGQILDGPYVLSPIPGAIALNIAQPYTIAGCQNVAGYVSSSTPAPPGGLVISLSDTLAAASVPSTVTISAGAIGATFTISTMPVSNVQSGVITATRNGRTVSQDLSVRPMGVAAITLTPSTVTGGKTVAGNVALECGAAPATITVSLSSSNKSLARPVPSTITIPKGQSSAAFQVTTQKVPSRVLVTIKGSANGISKTANLKLNR